MYNRAHSTHMLTIRLSRGGAKKRPYYRIVVAEKSFSRDGRFIERLGASNPMASGNESAFTIDMLRYLHWCEQGAQPSATVKRLVRAHQRSVTGATSPNS